MYAFSVRDGGATKVGWIPMSALRARADVPNPKMGAVVPVEEDAVPAAEAAKGGPNSRTSACPSRGPERRSGSSRRVRLPFAGGVEPGHPAAIRSLKVTPSSTSTNEKLADYLVRSDGTVGLNYNTPRLGGVATDHFLLVDGQPLSFERAYSTKERPTILRVRLYKKGAKTPERAVFFVFGRVRTVDGARFGWVPFRALKAATSVQPPSTVCLIGACKGLGPGPRCLEGPMVLDCQGENATPHMCPAGQRCIVTGDGSMGELTGNPPTRPTCISM